MIQMCRTLRFALCWGIEWAFPMDAVAVATAALWREAGGAAETYRVVSLKESIFAWELTDQWQAFLYVEQDGGGER